MKIFWELLTDQERVLQSNNLDESINPIIGFTALLLMTVIDFIFMFRIGDVEGGNPCLWFVIGGMLDLEIVSDLQQVYQWIILYPIKITGDLLIIALPGWIAVKRYGATREQFIRWFTVYCYTLAAIDLFLIAAMTPAVVLGHEGRPLMITNFLSYGVFAANAVIFTNAFKHCFKLRFGQAFYSWFIVAIVIPYPIVAVLFFIVP